MRFPSISTNFPDSGGISETDATFTSLPITILRLPGPSGAYALRSGTVTPSDRHACQDDPAHTKGPANERIGQDRSLPGMSRFPSRVSTHGLPNQLKAVLPITSTSMPTAVSSATSSEKKGVAIASLL